MWLFQCDSSKSASGSSNGNRTKTERKGKTMYLLSLVKVGYTCSLKAVKK